MLRRALAVEEKRAGPEADIARILNNLAVLLQETKRPREAELLLRRALAIDEQIFGPHHPTVANDLNNLGVLLRATDRSRDAEPLLRRALAIDEEHSGPEHPDVARDLNNLARVLQETNRLNEAEPLMRRMVEIYLRFSRTTGHPHPNLPAINNYPTLLAAMGQSPDEIRARLRKMTEKGSSSTRQGF